MAEGRSGQGYENSVNGVRDGGVNGIGLAGWLTKGGESGGRKVKKNGVSNEMQ